MNGYVEAEVVKTVKVSKHYFHIFLDLEEPLRIRPGQFIMIWLPEYEEVPMAPSWDDPLRITVKIVGPTTEAMSLLEPGEKVYVRGPYGRPFNIDKIGRYLLLAGGVGGAPLILAAKYLSGLSGSTYVEGVYTAGDKLFIDEALELGFNAVLYTEDGSSGVKGFPTDYLVEHGGEYDYILACGPEPMLKKVIEVCTSNGWRCQVSMERIVKCALGVCGSCVLDDTGLLVCLDGPVFNIDDLIRTDSNKM